MRMWLGVHPSEMCRKHLLGEHVELHMLAGCLVHGKNVRPWIEKKFVQLPYASKRHDELAQEILRRGYNHKSPFQNWSRPYDDTACFDVEHILMLVDQEQNRLDLAARCPECAARMKDKFMESNNA